MATYNELLEALRERARNTTEQGGLFEKAMCAYFRQDPERNFKNVWLWADWPERARLTGYGANDIGIDLVAVTEEDEICAIQCKFYLPDSSIDKKRVDSFLSTVGTKHFQEGLIVATSDKLTKNVKTILKDRDKDIRWLGLSELADQPFDWDLVNPLKSARVEKEENLWPHQEDAVKAVLAGFKKEDRGKLIMACGSGKTRTALHIAEQQAPKAGRVLFLVPSIALLSQSLRDWANQRTRPHTYLAVCSDESADKSDEDVRVQDMAIAPTTRPSDIRRVLARESDKLRVVFCTYHSLERIHEAQRHGGFPDFDLVICDEAHRTTGVETHGRGEDNKISAFSRIHDADFVQAKKRLYMTATPRLYAESAKAKAAEEDAVLYSMDNKEQYGEEFYRLDFSEAIKKELLSDYKVIILVVDEAYVNSRVAEVLSGGTALTLPDAAKIVGCYKALRYQGQEPGEGKTPPAPLRRAVSFSSRIDASKAVRDAFNDVVGAVSELQGGEYTCDVEHVDGSNSMLYRNNKIQWLKEDAVDDETGAPACRILSNAKCLTEGVDVPALDAIMFMNPRNSQVDVVQAVGRVMRKAKGKDYGYVILPVVIPGGKSPEEALNENDAYKTVWQVLRALRSHDNRFNATVNTLDLNNKAPDNIIVDYIIDESESGASDGTGGTESGRESQFAFDLGDVKLYTEAIYAKLVEKCGDRAYWETWAKDLAAINERLKIRIGHLVKTNAGVTGLFDDFVRSLHGTINDAIDTDQAVRLLAEHLITRPVFDALFKDYTFSDHNPVAQSLGAVLDKLDAHGLNEELRDMDKFYDSVRERAEKIDNSAGRQTVLLELYNKFFRAALPLESKSLGIAYTPVPIIDFLLRSTDHIVREEFGAEGLGAKGVSIIDPFTGTGSFIARLLQGERAPGEPLIAKADLPRKFSEEIFANDIMLLAYYLAAANIESAAHSRLGGGYKPFPGVVWTDTFNLYEQAGDLLNPVSKENNARLTRQKAAEIQVVIGNPPWRGAKKSENDAVVEAEYPALAQRVKETYAARSTATVVTALRNSYVRAIRWASDRIGEQGVVAFVTNGNFIDSRSFDGFRKTLALEFDSVWCLNLRGNANTKGEPRRKEGGGVFGEASKDPVAVLILVKKSGPKNGAGKAPARIHYADIGDYLSADDKRERVRQTDSITGAGLDWCVIEPNEQGDWINQRDPAFENFIPLGDLALKGKANDSTVFLNYSQGVKTNRDPWALNFSKDELSRNMQGMTAFYNEQCTRFAKGKAADSDADVQKFIDRDEKKIKWSGDLIDGVARNKQAEFDSGCIRTCLYRPFTKQHLYFSRQFNWAVYQMPKLFPAPDSKNRVICVTGVGAGSAFSALMTDTVPNHHTLDTGQCFPLYVYDESGERHDAIQPAMLARFQAHYENPRITADDVFYYIYGLLHSPEYRRRFADNLRREIPRIPLVPGRRNFKRFYDVGVKLSVLHLGYDNAVRWSLSLIYKGNKVLPGVLESDPELLRVGKMRLKQKNDPTQVVYNDHLTIADIPPEAWDYHVNGAPALKHVMERYQVKIDRGKSEIRNAPHDWRPDNPRYILDLFARVVTVAVYTQHITADLAELKIEHGPGDNSPAGKEEIFARVKPDFRSEDAALDWYRNSKLPGWGETAEDLVAQGRGDEVIEYFDAADAGLHA